VRELISGPIRTDTREISSKGFHKAKEHTFMLTGSNSTVYFGMAYPGEEKKSTALESRSDVTLLEDL
jgi:hypothetical protein